MPRIVTRALIGILFVLVIAGWALAANFALRVIPTGPGAGDDAVAAVVVDYTRAHVRAAAGEIPFEQVAQMVTGQAAATIAAEIASAPAPVPGLAFIAATPALLFRDGTSALYEVDYQIVHDGNEERVVEHVVVTFVGSKWLVATVWRIALDSGAPINADASPVPSTSPSAEPTAEPTPVPATLPEGFPVSLVPADATLDQAGAAPDGALVAVYTSKASVESLAAFYEASISALGGTPARETTGDDVTFTWSGGTVGLVPEAGVVSVYVEVRP